MGSPVRRLVPFVMRYRRSYLLGFACVVAATAIQLLGPWVLKFAIDDLNTGVTSAKLGLYAGALLGIAVGGGIFRFLVRRIIVGASRDLEFDLRNAFFAHLQRLPQSFFQRYRTGDLMSRSTADLSAVRMMIGPAMMYTSSTVLVFVVGLLLMTSISPWLTVVVLMPLPFVSVTVKLFGSAIHRRFERIQAQLSELSAVVQEALAGVRVVRAYGQEEAEIARFERANEEYVARNLLMIRLQGLFYPSMSLLFGFGAMLVLWVGSREVIQGRMTLGELVAFTAYLVMLSWPMVAFGWVTNLLQRGMASWKRMLEVLDATPAIADGEATARAGAHVIRGAIEFRDLTFGYNGRAVLDRVSVRIAPGETVAIVGPTGSGKSTLLGLLPRLHEPPAGSVFVDGVDVREIPLAVLRGAIGFVPQEPFLFSDTIGENIAFGQRARDASGEPHPLDRVAVERAGAVARLDKDVADFPKGYDTLVGERGLMLSGGQKQRAAIARAVIVDPPILVLDDALSSVDTYTEEEILGRLRQVMKTRTALIVSHRISTVRDADQILVLDGGRIVERGRHDELVALDGLYAALYRKQLLEEELAAS